MRFCETLRNHLASWLQVCCLKEKGGLGLRQARQNNLAMLLKVGWSLFNKKNSFWCDVFRKKYVHDASFMKIRPIIKSGCKWRIRAGQQVYFWSDWWVGNAPLSRQYQNNEWEHRTNKFLEYIVSNRQWDFSVVENDLDLASLLKIAVVPLLISTIEIQPNVCCWALESDGQFSVGYAYKMLVSTSSTLVVMLILHGFGGYNVQNDFVSLFGWLI
ncbi:hypothetical protein V6Z11_A11G192700 [Gossypium hirsutum]